MMPLELRLILITTVVVLTLVAAGAQIANVVRTQHALLASQQLYAAAPSASSDTWRPDGVCYAATTMPRMISAREMATAQTPGVREIGPEVFRPCQINGLVVPQPLAGAPTAGGQVILVSLSQQWLWAYQDQRLVLASPVTTGMPQLPTPQGSYAVQRKETDVTFYSLWPQGSPFYYSPEHINYAMFFRDIGYYIHDAPWRHAFGPGTQYPHTDPDGTHETGSHGCVNMPTPAAAALYAWVGLGARVIIVG
jgi:lipoprotein-anchoring transpeptidase ErfK/SrfK